MERKRRERFHVENSRADKKENMVHAIGYQKKLGVHKENYSVCTEDKNLKIVIPPALIQLSQSRHFLLNPWLPDDISYFLILTYCT